MSARRALSGFVAGVLFGIGLAVSQMTNPEKVLAFLNVAGEWDPSLLFVMAAATGTFFFGFRWATQKAPLFEPEHQLPTSKRIDARLVMGALVFGAGWGLAGYCPGPAIAGLGSGSIEPIFLVIAMIAGSQMARLFQLRSTT